MLLLLIFHKFVEPDGHFTFKIASDVHVSFAGSNTSHPQMDHVQNCATELSYFLQLPCACKFNICDLH
jgi:hypothetical protein